MCRKHLIVWHEGLMVKLYMKGIRGLLWHVVNSWYKDSTSSVLREGLQSEPFKIQQGVRQGGVLSPFPYCIFVDELMS